VGGTLMGCGRAQRRPEILQRSAGDGRGWWAGRVGAAGKPLFGMSAAADRDSFRDELTVHGGLGFLAVQQRGGARRTSPTRPRRSGLYRGNWCRGAAWRARVRQARERGSGLHTSAPTERGGPPWLPEAEGGLVVRTAAGTAGSPGPGWLELTVRALIRSAACHRLLARTS